MKIALLTIWHEKNYGAELQCYATVKVLEELGHDVELIDLRLSDMESPSLRGRLSLLLESVSPCNRKFEAFWKKYIPTTQRYHSVEEIQANPPVADIYMVGSDQVWNPDITKKFTTLFFLDFGEENIKRISYASSFGVPKWTHAMLSSEIERLLQRFACISCREISGVHIIKELAGLNAYNVVDPTLIWGKYENFVSNTRARDSLVCYPLGNDSELQKLSKELAESIGLEFVDNFNKRVLLKKIVWNRNSIEQWVTNIANARLVITRSFHGMLFSIMFNKDFIILAGGKNRNVRITDFLNEIGLIDRYFDTPNEIMKSRIWERHIEYNHINKKIDEMKNRSLYILNDMIND